MRSLRPLLQLRNEPNYDATGQQKTKIAQLCMALRLPDKLEYRLMTRGEAGQLIRELSSELRFRRMHGMP